jgi:hypothetical protein
MRVFTIFFWVHTNCTHIIPYVRHLALTYCRRKPRIFCTRKDTFPGAPASRRDGRTDGRTGGEFKSGHPVIKFCSSVATLPDRLPAQRLFSLLSSGGPFQQQSKFRSDVTSDDVNNPLPYSVSVIQSYMVQYMRKIQGE